MPNTNYRTTDLKSKDFSVIKYYKNRTSYNNKRGFFKLNTNQVRPDKQSLYKKVYTREYKSLIEEMKDLNDMEYICAGLNSYTREVVIVDCDDNDFGQKSFSLMKEANIIPHAIKVKPNGHSQFFFFIKKVTLGKAYFKDGHFYEKFDRVIHTDWKKLTKLMNASFNGDIGYTGYNCQNPFFKDGDITYLKPLNELYTLENLKLRLNRYIGDNKAYYDSKIIEYYQTRTQSLKNRQTVKFLDEITEPDEIYEALIQYEDSINKRLFVCTTQVCKSFKKKGNLKQEYLNEIYATVLKNWNYQDAAIGYTDFELKTRIINDIIQIINNNENKLIDWNKVGYTRYQRDLSLKVRRNKRTVKLNRLSKIINHYSDILKSFKYQNDMYEFIIEKYESIYGIKISLSSIRNYLMMFFKNNILKLHIHNIKKGLNRLIENIKRYLSPYNNKINSFTKKRIYYRNLVIFDTDRLIA